MVEPEPCHYFQTGSCQMGSACRYAHIIDPDFKPKPCIFFAKGQCRHGDACSYSHAIDSKPPMEPPRRERARSIDHDASTAEFRVWRYDVPRDKDTRPLGPVKADFWKKALAFVGSDAGLMQETIALLSGDGGLRRIQQLADRNFSDLHETRFRRFFDDHLLPFFELLTHENVRNSVILATRVMTIYNLLYNNGEIRPVRLFEAVARHLHTLDLHHTSPELPNEAAIHAIESSLAVFSKLIEVNTSAQIHEGLKTVAESFALILEDDMQEAVASATKLAKKHLRQIEQRLGLGQALPKARGTGIVNGSGPRATFQLSRDPPGELSEYGPRHDNDKVNITEISILPTLQEIQSPRSEYLPPADPLQWHFGGLEGLIDRQFRLLREDTVGQVRDAAKVELEKLQNPHRSVNSPSDKRQGARTFVYQNVDISDVAFDPTSGMEYVLRFDQPKALRAKSSAQRREWWENSKRLGRDAFICLLSSAGTAIFLATSPKPMFPSKDSVTGGKVDSLQKKYNLWSVEHHAYVVAKPVDQDSTPTLLELFHGGGNTRRSLVEFPGVLLPAFKPTLEGLQQMSDRLDVPFANILAPVSTPANPDREITLPPPEYATAPGFRFDLSAITADNRLLFLPLDADICAISAELANSSPLDPGQAEAVVSSLLRCIALIQGPPGTGKSYTSAKLIQVLLDVMKAVKLGPIIYVSFTNHALDQGLERLLDEGVDQMIRVGGFSKSERLTNVNLRDVAQKFGLTKTERSERWQLKKKIDEEAYEINCILNDMNQPGSQRSLGRYLRDYHPNHHDELFSDLNEDGFVVANYHNDTIIERWLLSGSQRDLAVRSIEELEDEDLFNMSNHERESLYRSWVESIPLYLNNKLNIALESYYCLKKQLDDIKTEINLRVLHQAQVIGLTTSGLARNLHLLRRIGAKILICEEAGEVLESSLLTALLPTIQHAILIGDHQQLRPHIQNYDLSTESTSGRQYALDVSLFERLVRPQDFISQPIPLCTLNVQRRMHPSISHLVREMQYPGLQDGATLDYPEVMGMRRRLFWMDHRHGETEANDVTTSSHTNDYEVDMVTALVRHLVRQGTYHSNDIAVITPYLGQLRKIRNKLAANFEIILSDGDIDQLQEEGDDLQTKNPTRVPEWRASVARGRLLNALRIATIDNFQGEEAKVVIVSLVRSNMKKNPGFLRSPNRINVLLSRAQHGMYILGDAKTIGSVQMWNHVLRILQASGNFGEELELCCPRHSDTPISIRSPDDFVRLSPEAGCNLPCNRQLSCGHACTSKCHSDLLHKAVRCLSSCTRPKPGCTHNCPLPCGDLCHKQCLENVAALHILSCGHKKTSLPCFQHQDLSKVLCDVLVTKVVRQCGHEVEKPCHVDVNAQSHTCAAPCDVLLDCGHQCLHPCHKCRTYDAGRLVTLKHPDCIHMCGRNYPTCKHHCKSKCHGAKPCPLCNEKCEVSCSHAACDKKCNEPCTPCAEPQCNSSCPHSQCKMPCAAPCDWLPCSMRCPKMLPCGCRCPGVCGEKCPDSSYCQTHATDDIRAMQADLILFEPYGSIKLDEDPCIFTACRHIFTLNTMDGIMDMKKHYAIDPVSDKCVALLHNAEPFSSEELKTCPECRGPLRDISRYGRIVRRALLDESAKKLTSWSNCAIQDLTKRLIQLERDLTTGARQAKKPVKAITLDGCITEQLENIGKLENARRYCQILALRTEIERFGDKICTSEQPYQRVRDLVETRRRSQQTQAIPEFHVAQSELQLREHLLAVSLLTRTDIVILSDVLRTHGKTGGAGPIKVNLESNRERCEEMVENAHETHNVRQETEGHIFWAMFAAMEYATARLREVDTRADQLRASALTHIHKAHEICNMFKNDDDVNPTEGLAEEANEAREMLEEGISNTEMRMIVATMNREFVSTGHWYRCENGHPFTIGECGRPMELARCPDCGANVGGQSHQPAAGVQEAHDITEQFGGLDIDD